MAAAASKLTDTQSFKNPTCGASGDMVTEHDRMLYQMRIELNNLIDHTRSTEDHQRLTNIGLYEALEKINKLSAVLEERITSLQEDKKTFWALLLAGAAIGWEIIKGSLAHMVK